MPSVKNRAAAQPSRYTGQVSTRRARKPPRILRLPVVMDRVGLKHSQLHALERRDLFPKRIKISTRASGWLECEIDEWIEGRVAASRLPSARPNAETREAGQMRARGAEPQAHDRGAQPGNTAKHAAVMAREQVPQ